MHSCIISFLRRVTTTVKLHFTRNNGPVDAAIDSLMDTADGIRRPEYIREMIIAALKARPGRRRARGPQAHEHNAQGDAVHIEDLRPLPERAQGHGLRLCAHGER